ncbi:hypothetical protein [Variovorax sp. 38R]|nr:hypothetical protein [Variovorax sp. 38R]
MRSDPILFLCPMFGMPNIGEAFWATSSRMVGQQGEDGVRGDRR